MIGSQIIAWLLELDSFPFNSRRQIWSFGKVTTIANHNRSYYPDDGWKGAHANIFSSDLAKSTGMSH